MLSDKYDARGFLANNQNLLDSLDVEDGGAEQMAMNSGTSQSSTSAHYGIAGGDSEEGELFDSDEEMEATKEDYSMLGVPSKTQLDKEGEGDDSSSSSSAGDEGEVVEEEENVSSTAAKKNTRSSNKKRAAPEDGNNKGRKRNKKNDNK